MPGISKTNRVEILKRTLYTVKEMSEQPTIESLLPLIAAPGRYCAANESGAIMIILANHIKHKTHGSLLVWLAIHDGMIKGFKIRIDTGDFDLSVPSIMNAVMAILALPDVSEREAAFKQRNIYPINAQELWDLIGRQDKSAYEHLKNAANLSKATRAGLSAAMYQYLLARGGRR